MVRSTAPPKVYPPVRVKANEGCALPRTPEAQRSVPIAPDRSTGRCPDGTGGGAVPTTVSEGGGGTTGGGLTGGGSVGGGDPGGGPVAISGGGVPPPGGGAVSVCPGGAFGFVGGG